MNFELLTRTVLRNCSEANGEINRKEHATTEVSEEMTVKIVSTFKVRNCKNLILSCTVGCIWLVISINDD
jgi:hypothetical protein